MGDLQKSTCFTDFGGETPFLFCFVLLLVWYCTDTFEDDRSTCGVNIGVKWPFSFRMVRTTVSLSVEYTYPRLLFYFYSLYISWKCPFPSFINSSHYFRWCEPRKSLFINKGGKYTFYESSEEISSGFQNKLV